MIKDQNLLTQLLYNKLKQRILNKMKLSNHPTCTLLGRVNAQNVSCCVSLPWPIYQIRSLDKSKHSYSTALRCHQTNQHCSTGNSVTKKKYILTQAVLFLLVFQIFSQTLCGLIKQYPSHLHRLFRDVYTEGQLTFTFLCKRPKELLQLEKSFCQAFQINIHQFHAKCFTSWHIGGLPSNDKMLYSLLGNAKCDEECFMFNL